MSSSAGRVEALTTNCDSSPFSQKLPSRLLENGTQALIVIALPYLHLLARVLLRHSTDLSQHGKRAYSDSLEH
jgi:hypothetical protein